VRDWSRQYHLRTRLVAVSKHQLREEPEEVPAGGHPVIISTRNVRPTFLGRLAGDEIVAPEYTLDNDEIVIGVSALA